MGTTAAGRLHHILFRFSPDDDRRIGEIWNGPHPEGGQELEVQDCPPEGAVPPDLDAEPQLTSLVQEREGEVRWD